MKSGSTEIANFQAHVDLRQFEGMHRDRDCHGQWQITITWGQTAKLTIDALGPVQLGWIPLVTCHSCRSSYEVPGFQRFIETLIANHLVKSKELLTKKQIRFLRQYFGLTQANFATRIGVADKFVMSKIESEHSERRLDPDGQVRLKLHCAKLLKIKDLEDLYGLADVNEAKTAEIPSSIFPPRADAERIIHEIYEERAGLG